jgi:hypothetical protein
MFSRTASLFLSLASLASLVLFTGCDMCDGVRMSTWTSTPLYGGSIEAPEDLGLPAQIERPGAFCDSGGGCFQDGRCWARVCMDIHKDGSTSFLNLDLKVNFIRVGENIALPSSSPDVTLEASIAGKGTRLPLKVTNGTITFVTLGMGNDFDLRMDLVLATPDGRTITITNGRYGTTDTQHSTYCQS